MKKILLSLFAMISWAAGAQTPVHYGYAPDNVVPEEIQAKVLEVKDMIASAWAVEKQKMN